ncbi:hypothetical protein GTY80_19775 [Amycolatopsis sp. SID8362]|nr:hypothetical protein [Amycolatopsis sp. SID8362]NED42182.1 hypothetical protein [Amycolatopsis sp. SID8362]
MTSDVPALIRQPYPVENDKLIRHWANEWYIDNGDAISTLNRIRDELFGNADQVHALAEQWAANTVIASGKQSITTATTNLAGYWQGPAAESFGSWVGSNGGGVLSVFESNGAAMTDIGTTLGNCAAEVYNTYGNAINAIGQCAGALAGIATDVAFNLVPGLNVLADIDIVDKVSSALDTFVTAVAGFIADAVKQIGAYKAQGVTVTAAANYGFTAVPPPGALVGYPDKWWMESQQRQ